MGPSEPNDLYPTHIPTQNIKFEAKLTFWRRIPKTWKWGRLISGISYFQTQWVISMEMKRTHWKCTKKFSLYSFKSFGKSHHWNLVYVPLHSAPHYMIQLSWIFLDAIASPCTYPCQSVGQWVSEFHISNEYLSVIHCNVFKYFQMDDVLQFFGNYDLTMVWSKF